jgi:hypothetical protein
MINRFRFIGFWLSVGCAMAVVALAPRVAFAQQRGAAPAPAAVAEAPLTPLKIQVIVTRLQGQKQVSREPFTLAVTANDKKMSEVQSGTQVLIPMVTMEGKTVGPVFKDVGTHIQCLATTADGNRFRLDLSVEAALLDQDQPKTSPPYRIRSFRSSQPLLMRDGQTTEYTTATDPTNGEEVKVAVTMTVVR